MLTNFQTIRKSIKRLQNIEKMESDGTFEKITKKERLVLTREKDKLRKVLDGVETLAKMPGALFIVDIKKESIAVNEALRLNIPLFAIVDTNCDPAPIDYIIPANDDASRAVEVITRVIADAVIEGNAKSKELRAHEAAEKESKKENKEEQEVEKKDTKGKVRRVRIDEKGDKKPQHRDRRDNRQNRPAQRREEKPVEKREEKPEVKPVEKKEESNETKAE